MEPIHDQRRTTLIPLAVIVCGVALQLQSSGLLGKPATDFLTKSWPLIILAAGIDLFFSSKRIIGAIVMTLTAIFSLVIHFSGNAQAAALFTSFWPVLLIIYGIDMLLSGKNLANGILIIIVVSVGLFFTFGAKGVLKLPAIKIPENISTFLTSNSSAPQSDPGGTRTLAYTLPDQSSVTFRLDIPSGKVQVKSLPAVSTVLSGTVKLAQGEAFIDSMEVEGDSAVYTLACKANPQLTASEALWDLQLSQQIPVNWDSIMNDGYQMIDLRGINLASARIINQNGNIDVMLPQTAVSALLLGTQKGDIRIFVPGSVAAFVNIAKPATVSYPAGYLQSGGQIFPEAIVPGQIQIVVNVNNSGEGTVKVVAVQH